MKKILLSSLLIASSTCTYALEGEIHWNAVDLNYSSFDMDDSGTFEPTGVEFKADYLLNENVFVTGSYSRVSDDISVDFRSLNGSTFNIESTISTLKAGVGYRFELTTGVDGYGSISYLNQELEAEVRGESSSTDASGTIATIGVKFKPILKLELFGQVSSINASVDEEDDDINESSESYSDTELKIGARYKFDNSFAVSTSYAKLDDYNVFNFGGSYYF